MNKIKEQEILEGNKLIAEFMGWKNVVDYISEVEVYHKASPSCSNMFIKFPTLLYNFKYNKSWDWLIPVVTKIDNTFLDQMQLSTGIGEKDFVVYGTHIFTEGDNKIEAVWKGVVEFIKWYNENKRIKERN